jgi:CRP/FNR family transcriptional regulator
MKKDTCDTGSCILCHTCLPEWRDLIAIRKESLLYRKGASIFTEGDPVTGMFFMRSGAVKVHKKWGSQKDLIIRFVGGVDILGLRGMGGSSEYPVSATALDTTRVCFIPGDFLEASLKANPAFSYRMMQFYAAELQKAERRMSDLALMDVKGRLARALIALQEAFGNDDAGNIAIEISRQDIAAYAGTIYETVFKIFSEWIDTSIISTVGKRIQVLNQEALNAFTVN